MRLTALGGGVFVRTDGILEKSLSPRNIPPEDAISGLRDMEERFTATLYGLVREGMKAVVSAKSESDAILYTRAAMDRFSELSEAAALAHIDEVYTRLIKEAQGEFPSARREDADARSVQMLENLPDGLIPSLKALSDDVTLRIEDVVRRFFQSGTDALAREIEKIVPLARTRLELIARTETSRVANLGRATQLMKYVGPGAEVDWVLANHPLGDARTCQICKAIANGGVAVVNKTEKTFHGNPYTIQELESLVAHLVAHPNERCVVARRV